MAIRNVRKIGDPLLRKKSKVVEKIDRRTLILIEDMIDSMYEEDGVGLAAPQVGLSLIHISTEDKIRKIISKSLIRGKVDIFITQNNSGKSSGVATFNKELGDSYFKCLTDIKEMYNLSDEPTLSLLSKFPEIITVEAAELDEEEAFRVLKVALDEAVENIVLMRVKEGEKLKEDLLKKLQGIEKNVDLLCELGKDLSLIHI